ncbi:MAG: hypothetical protein Q6366_006555, partial [Candidatus Freyarchaeota archaeon]
MPPDCLKKLEKPTPNNNSHTIGAVTAVIRRILSLKYLLTSLSHTAYTPRNSACISPLTLTSTTILALTFFLFIFSPSSYSLLFFLHRGGLLIIGPIINGGAGPSSRIS